MSRLKKEILNKLKEYAGKMGKDHLGGDAIDSPKRGGLRDFDGYDNVQYNKDMPMDEMQVVNKKTGKDITKHVLALLSGKIDKKKFEKLTGLKKESVNEGKVDRVVGHSRYKYVGDGRKGKAIVSGPMKDREKEAIIKRAKKAGYVAKPNMGGGVTIHVESIEESMFSAIDQIRQDSKDVRDFVKNVFKDREFKKMSNDKDFIKYLKSIYEGTTNEAIPQNFHQGRTSDYHTALRGKNRDYSGGTNFKKTNHGQPDVEEDDEDQETNHLSNKQTHIKSPLKMAESGKKKSDKKYKGKHQGSNYKWPMSKATKDRKEADKKLKEYGQRLDLSFIEDEEAKLDGTYPSTDAIDRDIDEKVDNYYLKNAKFRLKKVYKYLDIEYKTTRRGLKYVQINYIPVTKPQSQNPEFVNVGYEDEKDLQIIGKALKLKLKESVSEVAKRDYKDEYKKFQSSKKSKKYRAELNKYNRDKGTYGNGDGKDASHKGGKIVGFESESKNRGRAEKSRLKKESVVNEIGQFPINNYIQGIIPQGRLDTNTAEAKRKSAKLVKDLRSTLNNFWKSHDIPYRIK